MRKRILRLTVLAAAFTLGACAQIRARLGGDHPVAPPLPGEPPTSSAFAGIDRVLRAPGPGDGRVDRISYPTAAGTDRILPGDSALVLDEPGPGVVRRIRVDLRSGDPEWLRRVVVRMYWDDEVDPSVEVPLGDFFGNPFDRRPFASLPMGVAPGGFFSYLAMPFARHARIAIVNETGLAIEGLSFDADVEAGAELGDRVATFHAAWSRDARPRADRRHLVADLTGTGWYVGTSLAAQAYDSTLAFLEGEEVTRVDGRLVRATAAAYLAESGGRGAPFAGAFQGTVLRDDPRGRLAAYRWHLPDPIPFRESLRIELERGPANSEAADYATVAYWYQVEPHKPLPPLPSAAERRVPDVVLPVGALWRDELDMFGTGGGTLNLTVPAPRPDRYELVVYPEASPGSPAPTARVRLPGHPARAFPVERPGAEPGDVLSPVVIDTVGVTARTVELEIAAPGGVSLPAAVLLRPLARWAQTWWVLGPWPGEAPLDSVWAPEQDPDYLQAYRVPGAGLVRWDSLDADASGTLALARRFAGEEETTPNTAYAQTWVRAPSARLAALLLTASGPYQIWVNGARVPTGPRGPGAAETQIDAPLRAGWNQVMVKLPDDRRAWALRLRAADPEAALVWGRNPVY